jgi:hypothetical protein
METEKSSEGQKISRPTVEALIQSEWVTIKQLEKMLVDPEVTVKEKTSVANVLAFHVNTLNRLLMRSGGKEQFDEQNLGDFIKGVEPRILRRFRRDFREWKRSLTYRRY